MLCDFHIAGGPAWMALRYFNAAGASLDGEIGECHEPESHLIPRACFAALGLTLAGFVLWHSPSALGLPHGLLVARNPVLVVVDCAYG